MTKNATTNDTGKKERKHPYYLLRPCLDLAQAVNEIGGGRAGVPRSVLASHLGALEDSSAFAQLIASAKTYGLIEGTSELRLTELASQYFHPTTETAKRLAELECLVQPSAYRFLVNRFDGRQIPPTAIMANLIGKDFKIPASWSTRAATIFLSVANDLGVVDANRCLRFEATKHNAAKVTAGGANTRSATEEVPFRGRIDSSGDVDYFQIRTDIAGPQTIPVLPMPAGLASLASSTNTWLFSEGGGTVRLETPDPLPRPLWERLKRYVEVLEPPPPQ